MIIAGACGPGAGERLVPILADDRTGAKLAGIGPATFGATPGSETSLWSNDAFLITADARIDDRTSLLQRLGLNGATLSDAAIIAHAWQRWGEDAPNELYGDYAFALFDHRSEALWLVRDALGFRPLAFTSRGPANLFCSLPSRLAVDNRPSPLAMARARASHATPLTWFAGVEQVQPGERVLLRPGSAARTFWWQPSTTPAFAGTREDFQREMHAALESAVADRIAGAAQIATHLSAGLDSMAVTLTAAAQLPANTPIHAITARPIADVALTRPRGWLVDETASAARIAARYPNLHHGIVDASGRSIAAAAAEAAGRFGQPLTNTPNFSWIDASCDAARAAGADRMLIAQMGNFGLSTVAGDYWGPLLQREGIARFVAEWRQGGRFRAPLGELLRRLRPSLSRGDMWLGIIRSLDPGLLLKGFARQGLLVLDPTADRRIIELALTVPQNLLVRNGDPRWVVREMLRGRVPEDILDSPQRGFQSADWLGRLRAEAGELAAILDGASRSSGLRFDESQALLRTIAAGFSEELDTPAKGDLARDLAIAGFLVARAGQAETGAAPAPAPSLPRRRRFAAARKLALLGEAAALHAYASLIARRKAGRYFVTNPRIATHTGRTAPSEMIAATLRISRLWPARSVCLHRALILYWMLRRRGFDAQLHYGITPVSRGLSAHSWTSLDGTILIGAEEHDRYREVTREVA